MEGMTNTSQKKLLPKHKVIDLFVSDVVAAFRANIRKHWRSHLVDSYEQIMDPTVKESVATWLNQSHRYLGLILSEHVREVVEAEMAALFSSEAETTLKVSQAIKKRIQERWNEKDLRPLPSEDPQDQAIFFAGIADEPGKALSAFDREDLQAFILRLVGAENEDC